MCGKVFCFGGAESFDANNGSPVPVNTVLSASIDGSGVVGSFTTEATTMPVAVYGASIFATEGHLYLLGGFNSSGTVQSIVQSVVINADGSLGAWSNSPYYSDAYDTMPCVVHGSRVFMVGANRSGGWGVRYSNIGSYGTTWGSVLFASGIDGGRYGVVPIIIDDKLIVISGYSPGDGGLVDSVLSAGFDSGGDIVTPWSSYGFAADPEEAIDPFGVAKYSLFSFGSTLVLLGGGGPYTPGSNPYIISTNFTDGEPGTWSLEEFTALTGGAWFGGYSNSEFASTSCFITSGRIYIVGGYVVADWDDVNEEWNASVEQFLLHAPFSGGANDYTGEVYDETIETNNASFDTAVDNIGGVGVGGAVGWGQYSPTPDTVSGRAQYYYNKGDISTAHDRISAEASTDIIGWGRFKDRRHLLSGFCSQGSGEIEASGDFVEKITALNGTGETGVFAWGGYSPKVDTVHAQGQAETVIHGHGDFSQRVDVISGVALRGAMGSGMFLDAVCALNGSASVEGEVFGNFIMPVDGVKGKSVTALPSKNLLFSRDAVVKPTAPSGSVVDPLSFSRCSCN